MRWATIGVALIVGFLGFCNPKPPQPQPPQYRAIAFNTLGVSHPTVYLDGIGTQTGNEAGYTLFAAVPYSLVYSYVVISADGYDTYRQDALCLGDVAAGQCTPAQHQFDIALTHTYVPLPRLTINGQHIGTEAGSATLIGLSSFTLYQQYLDGVDIHPVLNQARDLGFNILRVFGRYDNPTAVGGIGHFRPEDYPMYWASLQAFFRELGKAHLYIQWVPFADTTKWTCDQQLSDIDRTKTALGGAQTNVMVSWVNEADQPINVPCGASSQAMGAIPGVFVSKGSNGSQAPGVMPYLDYTELHTNDAFEEQRKVGHNCWELSSKPCFTSETSRAPTKANWQSVHPDWFAYDAAAGAALLAAGSLYHSDAGKAGRVMDGSELSFAQSWVAGARSVPLSCQNQPYSRRDDLLTPELLRVYQRGSDPACIVRIRRPQ